LGRLEGEVNQVYWLDPIRSGDLLRAVLKALVGGSRVAIEGEADAIELCGLLMLPGAGGELSPPFRREYKPDSAVVVLPLESRRDARRICEMVSTEGKVRAGIEAIQVERHGRIEFLAGDGFHRECVSVGAGVPEGLLRDLTRKRIIEGFYTLSEARKHFGLPEEP
jgi:hypothetical protein